MDNFSIPSSLNSIDKIYLKQCSITMENGINRGLLDGWSYTYVQFEYNCLTGC